MIQMRACSEEKIDAIAAVFAEAFCAEPGSIASAMSETQARQYFAVTLKAYSRHGLLYALSEKEEGYCVYFRKNNGLPWYSDLLMLYRYMRVLPSGVMQKMILIRHGWDDYTIAHLKDDYVDVSLVAIRKEYRGQGLLRQILKEPFALADRCGIPCILDTDSPLKAAKYEHVGMRTERHMELTSGLHMYTMIYDPA